MDFGIHWWDEDDVIIDVEGFSDDECMIKETRKERFVKENNEKVVSWLQICGEELIDDHWTVDLDSAEMFDDFQSEFVVVHANDEQVQDDSLHRFHLLPNHNGNSMLETPVKDRQEEEVDILIGESNNLNFMDGNMEKSTECLQKLVSEVCVKSEFQTIANTNNKFVEEFGDEDRKEKERKEKRESKIARPRLTRSQLRKFLNDEFNEVRSSSQDLTPLFEKFPSFDEWFELNLVTNQHQTRDHDFCFSVEPMTNTVAVTQMRDLPTNKHIYLSDVPTRLLNALRSEDICDDLCDVDDHVHCFYCDKFYRPFCPEHPLFFVKTEKKIDGFDAKLTCPSYFYIRKSKIPGAGLGAFTRVPLAMNLVVGPYDGEVHFNKNRSDRSGYAWEIGIGEQNFFIDAQDPMHSNWLRYINSAEDVHSQNMLAFQYRWRIYYRVMKPIKPGEELLVFYGDNYKFKRTKKLNVKS